MDHVGAGDSTDAEVVDDGAPAWVSPQPAVSAALTKVGLRTLHTLPAAGGTKAATRSVQPPVLPSRRVPVGIVPRRHVHKRHHQTAAQDPKLKGIFDIKRQRAEARRALRNGTGSVAASPVQVGRYGRSPTPVTTATSPDAASPPPPANAGGASAGGPGREGYVARQGPVLGVPTGVGGAGTGADARSRKASVKDAARRASLRRRRAAAREAAAAAAAATAGGTGAVAGQDTSSYGGATGGGGGGASGGGAGGGGARWSRKADKPSERLPTLMDRNRRKGKAGLGLGGGLRTTQSTRRLVAGKGTGAAGGYYQRKLRRGGGGQFSSTPALPKIRRG